MLAAAIPLQKTRCTRNSHPSRRNREEYCSRHRPCRGDCRRRKRSDHCCQARAGEGADRNAGDPGSASQVGEAPKAESAKASTVHGEVVSTDATAKTITLKDATGASTTLTATGGAVAALANLKAGDMVTVTKSENNATHITKAKSSTKKTAKYVLPVSGAHAAGPSEEKQSTPPRVRARRLRPAAVLPERRCPAGSTSTATGS